MRTRTLNALAALAAVSALTMPAQAHATASPPTSTCPAGQQVSTAAQLTAALSSATPGAVIDLASGTYAGPFTVTASGMAAAPIQLCGPADAILDGNGGSHAFYLVGASWWILTGFQITHGIKGLDLSGSSNDVASGLYIHDTVDAAVHVESFSSGNTFTGLVTRNSADGFYIGSAKSNWCMYSGCNPDTSNNNIVEYSDVAANTAEGVDVKEGTTGTQVVGNHFDGSAETVKAWVNVKGNGALVSGNTGVNPPRDGYDVHVVATGWGQNDSFTGNAGTGPGTGYGFYIQAGATGSTAACGQAVSGFASGYSNIPCT